MLSACTNLALLTDVIPPSEAYSYVYWDSIAGELVRRTHLVAASLLVGSLWARHQFPILPLVRCKAFDYRVRGLCISVCVKGCKCEYDCRGLQTVRRVVLCYPESMYNIPSMRGNDTKCCFSEDRSLCAVTLRERGVRVGHWTPSSSKVYHSHAFECYRAKHFPRAC